MNIYLIERTDRVGWDECSGAVVLAASADDARAMFPHSTHGMDWTYDAALIQVTLIGVATPEYCAACADGMVLAAYKAG